MNDITAVLLMFADGAVERITDPELVEVTFPEDPVTNCFSEDLLPRLEGLTK